MTTGHYISKVRRKIHRDNILKTGKELFIRHGYNYVSINDITSKIKIPKGSFYNHFKSKNEFLFEVLKKYESDSFELIKKHLIDSDSLPLLKLSNYFAEATNFYSDDLKQFNGCLIGNTCQELGNIDSETSIFMEKNFAAVNVIITPILQDAIDRKELKYDGDLTELSDFITNSWQGALLRTKASRDKKPLYTFRKILFNQILTK